MCDVPEEEFAEYMLWNEAAIARARTPRAVEPSRYLSKSTRAGDSVLEPVPA
ncbi:MAG: hypothetical protein L3J68_01915 [Thermoplasmata archaeon]|nr:hypothetical protein [Thermoplasmata archaeon]